MKFLSSDYKLPSHSWCPTSTPP